MMKRKEGEKIKKVKNQKLDFKEFENVIFFFFFTLLHVDIRQSEELYALHIFFTLPVF